MNLILFILTWLGLWIILDYLQHIDHKLDKLLKEKEEKENQP